MDTKIETKKIWNQFASLPEEAQREVVDFISFLLDRYKRIRTPALRRKSKLSKDPFFGMWKNRKEMSDSTAWVRNIREHEWRMKP